MFSYWTKSLTLALFGCLALQMTGIVHAQEIKPTISVRGSAQVTLMADSAVVTATLQASAAEAAQVFESAEKQTENIMAFLKQSGIGENDVRLQPMILTPYIIRGVTGKGQALQSSVNGRQVDEPDRTMYRASRQLHIALTDFKKLNQIHLGLIQRGIQRLDRVEFKSSKSEAEFAKIRQTAVRDARTKAAAMAAELGAELASIRSMVDQSSPFPMNTSRGNRYEPDDPFGSSDGLPGGMGMGGSMGGGESTPSVPTMVTHVASVDIVFNLGKTELSKTELSK